MLALRSRTANASCCCASRLTAKATVVQLPKRNYATPSPKDPLVTQLQSGLKDSMRAKDTFRSQVIKSALADIQTFQHQEKPPAPIQTLFSSISKRKDAIKVYESQNREDLVAQFQKEIGILDEFVPEDAKELSLAELAELTDAVMKELGIVKGSTEKGSLNKIIKEVRTRSGLRIGNLGRELADNVKKALAA